LNIFNGANIDIDVREYQVFGDFIGIVDLHRVPIIRIIVSRNRHLRIIEKVKDI
jgi:hypothetical protein